MCKINGHSIFTYMFQPWKAGKIAASKQNEKKIQQARNQATQEINANVKNEELQQDTATTTKQDNKKRQDLSSLRIPLNTSTSGASVSGDSTRLGLNLGG